LADYGEAKQVCDEYEKHLFGGSRTTANTSAANGVPQPAAAKCDPSLVASCEIIYGNGKANIESAWLEDAAGNRINVLESGAPFRWCYRVQFNENVSRPIFAMMLKTKEGIALYGVDSTRLPNQLPRVFAGEYYDIAFALSNTLAPGTYYLNCGVRIETELGVEFLSRRVDSAILRVTASKHQTVVTGVLEMTAELSIVGAQPLTE
jgi:lipopolysaccharide transport system ATP-binding protein